MADCLRCQHPESEHNATMLWCEHTGCACVLLRTPDDESADDAAAAYDPEAEERDEEDEVEELELGEEDGS